LLILKNLDIDTQLDIIFEYIDDLLIEHDFEKVDELLLLRDLTPDLAVGILTVTLPAKEFLKNRQNFLEYVAGITDCTLDGL
jgi:hypothetical protein